MPHEQSETIQRKDGKWINVYGRKTPKAGTPLPGERPYDSREEAEEAARRRSKEHKPPGRKPNGRGGLLEGLPGASAVIVRRAPRLGGAMKAEERALWFILGFVTAIFFAVLLMAGRLDWLLR